MITRIVTVIRKRYRNDVTIILSIDSGFFDEVNFKVFDKLGMGFICTGKMCDNVKNYVKSQPKERARKENYRVRFIITPIFTDIKTVIIPP